MYVCMYVCSEVQWAECSLIIGMDCRVQVFSLILDSLVGLSAGIQSAGDSVPETLWFRILHTAEEDNLSPFNSKIACLCQSIEINSNTYVCMYMYIYIIYIYMALKCIYDRNDANALSFLEGSLYTARINIFAQLGHHATQHQKLFSNVEGLPRVKQIAVGGGWHCVVLTNNGQVCNNSSPHTINQYKMDAFISPFKQHFIKTSINAIYCK